MVNRCWFHSHDLWQLKGFVEERRREDFCSGLKIGTSKNFYKPNSRSNQWLSAISFRAMAPAVKSFRCSRQGGEDWICLVNWGIWAKRWTAKNVNCWEIQRKSAVSKRNAGHYAGQWYHPLSCLNATSGNFTTSQVPRRPKRLPLHDMNISFIQVSFHWWSFFQYETRGLKSQLSWMSITRSHG